MVWHGLSVIYALPAENVEMLIKQWNLSIFDNILGGFNFYRLELHPDSGSTKPELVFMDCVEEVAGDLVTVKNEQSVVIKMKDQNKVVITSSVSICLIIC